MERLTEAEHYNLPVPGTARGKRTRARIMDAAEEVFGQMGFEAASITAITQAAGVAQGTFYVYFPSKHAIFVELIKDFGERVRTSLSEASANIRTKAERRAEVELAGLEAWLSFCIDHPGLYRVMREAAIVAPATHRWYYETFVGAYVTHFDVGGVTDAETIGYAMVAIADWIGLRWVIWEGRRPPPLVIKQIFELIDGGFEALRDT